MNTVMSKTLQAQVIIPGQARGPALVTRQPLNFTAAMCKPANILPSKRAQIWDRHHELFKEDVAGKVMVLPSCIGSTHTGLVLLDLVSLEHGPAALIVQDADSLMVSGVVLSDVWFGKSIPVLEYHGEDLFEHIANGQTVSVTEAGVIQVD